VRPFAVSPFFLWRIFALLKLIFTMVMLQKVLLSTAYFPPVHFFGAIAATDCVTIEKHETYSKQTYRNRCDIYTANGRLSLTIPVNKVHGNHTRIDEVHISDQSNWRLNHWRAILAAYTNSPYFLYYGDKIKELLFNPEKNLFSFNNYLITQLLQILRIDKELHFTESFIRNPDEVVDLRNLISPKSDNNLFQFKSYYQTFGEKYGFLEGLSILDLLFNLGPESRAFLSA